MCRKLSMRSSLQSMGMRSRLRCQKCYCFVLQGLSVKQKYMSCFQKRRPKKYVQILHDNKFLEDEKKKKEKTDLAQSDYFLLPRINKKKKKKKKKKMSYLIKIFTSFFSGIGCFPVSKGYISKNDYRNVFFILIKRLKLCIKINGDYFEGMK